MSSDRFKVLGRVCGSDLARMLVDILSTGSATAAEGAEMAKEAINEQLDRLRHEGASEAQLDAFALAADQRYAESLEEIMARAELGMIQQDPPSGSAH